MSQRNRKRGKSAEKAIAEALGGARVGLLGGEDVFHPKFSIEVKSREKFVVEKWFKQCEKNNKKDKIPLVIVHVLSNLHDNDYCILKLKDFKHFLDPYYRAS